MNLTQIILMLKLTMSAVLASSVPAPVSIESTVDSIVNSAAATAKGMALLEKELEPFVNALVLPGETWSVAVAIPDTELRIDIGDTATAASTIKLFVCGAVLENMENLSLDEQEVKELVFGTLSASDNYMASELVALCGGGDTTAGKELVNAYCKLHGFDETYLGILFSGMDPTGTGNITSAKDSADFMCDLLEGNLAYSDYMLSCMDESERTSKIPESLPEGVRTANKTGELEGAENDTCIVYGDPVTYVVSIMADDVDNYLAVERMQAISRMVYQAFEQGQIDKSALGLIPEDYPELNLPVSSENLTEETDAAGGSIEETPAAGALPEETQADPE